MELRLTYLEAAASLTAAVVLEDGHGIRAHNTLRKFSREYTTCALTDVRRSVHGSNYTALCSDLRRI